MLAVTGHFGCIAVDSKEKWEKRIASAEYHAVSTLFQRIKTGPYESMKYFERGEPVRPELHDELLSNWQQSENLNFLELLKCRNLFDECIGHEKKVCLLEDTMAFDDENADLEELRESRYGPTLPMRLLEDHVNESNPLSFFFYLLFPVYCGYISGGL